MSTKLLGDKIRGLREKKDMSLRELARKLEMSASFMSDIELNRRNPRPEVLEKISKVLGVSIEDLEAVDNRTTLADITNLMKKNPRFGIAFRKVVDTELSPDELLKLIDERKNDAK